MQKLWLFILTFCFITNLIAQSTWIKQDLCGLEMHFVNRNDSDPWMNPDIVLPMLDVDSLNPWFQKGRIKKHVFYNHLIEAKSSDYSLYIDPAFNFQYMRSRDASGYINTRGFHLAGQLKEVIWFSSSFFENQGRFPDYMNDFARKYGVLPGYSRMKEYKDTDWDYASAIGSVVFHPSDNWNFRLGHDKLMIGAGHRSLFISDAGFQQLFLQSSVSFGKFVFTNLSMQWMNPNFNDFMQLNEPISVEGNYSRKMNSIHILQYMPTDEFTISFVEAVVFHPENGRSDFAVQMINPFIFSRSLMIGFEGEDNLLVGLDLKYQTKKTIMYAQFIIDDWQGENLRFDNPANRGAYQLGIIRQDFLSVKNLYGRVEHNYVKALTYAHENPEVSYTHYNQNVTNPVGSNFAEFLVQLQYRKNRMPFQLQVNYLMCGNDSTSSESLSPLTLKHEGGYLSGDLASRIFIDAETGWCINPSWHLIAFVGVTARFAETDEFWVRFGLRTNLDRQIRDF